MIEDIRHIAPAMLGVGATSKQKKIKRLVTVHRVWLFVAMAWGKFCRKLKNCTENYALHLLLHL